MDIEIEFESQKPWCDYRDSRISSVFNSLDSELQFWIRHILEPELMEALPESIKRSELMLKKYIFNSAKFNKLISDPKSTIRGDGKSVRWVIGTDKKGNTKESEIEGDIVKLDEIGKLGLNPNFILVFRRGQLFEDYQRFWTTDYKKVRDDLWYEIPEWKRKSTKILVSTLFEISREGGAIIDYTDVSIGTALMRVSEDTFKGRLLTVISPGDYDQI